MRKLVMLTRSFLFDPGEVGWTRVSEVDASMARWLSSMGLQGEKIELMGQPESGIIKITKKEQVPGIVAKPIQTKVKTPKQQFKAVMSKIDKPKKK